MEKIKIGDVVNCKLAEGEKMLTIEGIFWSEKGDYWNNEVIPKREIFKPAKDWCIFLFKEGGYWAKGNVVQTIN